MNLSEADLELFPRGDAKGALTVFASSFFSQVVLGEGDGSKTGALAASSLQVLHD